MLKKILKINPVSREHAVSFARFIWHRFVADRCFESAGAMSYTTVFAIVPLSTAALGLMAAFPVFQVWTDRITSFVFENFVPAAGSAVQEYLGQFAVNATQLTGVGIVVLVGSALVMMASVEETFNRIWRVNAPRRRLARFVMYWTVLTLGPLLVAASLAVSSQLMARAFSPDTANELMDVAWFWQFFPVIITWSVATLAFVIIPNTTVRLKHAAVGALLVTVLFESSKQIFASYLFAFPSYQQIYGALAAVPIFLLWIYVSWAIILLGASVAASLSAFRFLPEHLRITSGMEFAAMLQTLNRIVTASHQGKPLTYQDLLEAEPGMTDEQILRFLGQLETARIIQRSETGAWILMRELIHIRCEEIFVGGRYHWPLANEIELIQTRYGNQLPEMVTWLQSGRECLQTQLYWTLGRLLPQANANDLASDSSQSRSVP